MRDLMEKAKLEEEGRIIEMESKRVENDKKLLEMKEKSK